MYQLSTTPGVVVRLSDGATIPLGDMDGMAQREYADWLYAGNTPGPYVAPVIVPDAVSAFQARAALAGAGLLDHVEGMMTDPATPLMARLAWQHATEFKRTSPTVAAMGAALQLDDGALDTLFVNAATIVA